MFKVLLLQGNGERKRADVDCCELAGPSASAEFLDLVTEPFNELLTQNNDARGVKLGSTGSTSAGVLSICPLCRNLGRLNGGVAEVSHVCSLRRITFSVWCV
jgi:hypothetical protein